MIHSQYEIINAWICQIEGIEIHPVYGDLQIDNGRISKVRKRKFPEFSSLNNSEEQIDAQGRMITIPLTNFHDHIYSRLAKGLPIKGSMENFSGILENMWWTIDRELDMEMITACAEIAAIESIRNGVTYIFDHHSSPNNTTGSLSAISTVLQKYYLRGVLCFETSDRNGAEKASLALEENRRFIMDQSTDDIRGMLGLHALFTLSDDTLIKSENLVRESSAYIHIHLAEDVIDRDYNRNNFNLTPAQRLQKYCLLSANTILAHAIHLVDIDYKIISDSGSAIVYCPDSNLNNAVGLPKYAAVSQEIPIIVGTDGMHANIAGSLKQLFLLYRMQGNDFASTFNWMQKIYFDQLTFLQKWFPDFPGLCEGDRADLVLWDYIPPTHIDKTNFWGHYIYGVLESKADSVFQEGQALMKRGKLSISESSEYNRMVMIQGERLYNKLKDPE